MDQIIWSDQYIETSKKSHQPVQAKFWNYTLPSILLPNDQPVYCSIETTLISRSEFFQGDRAREFEAKFFVSLLIFEQPRALNSH